MPDRCSRSVQKLLAIFRLSREKNPAVATAAFCEPRPIEVPASAVADAAFCEPWPIEMPASAAAPHGVVTPGSSSPGEPADTRSAFGSEGSSDVRHALGPILSMDACAAAAA